MVDCTPKDYEWKRISSTFFFGNTHPQKRVHLSSPMFFGGEKSVEKSWETTTTWGNSYEYDTPQTYPPKPKPVRDPAQPLFVITALHHQWSPSLHLLRIFGIFHPSVGAFSTIQKQLLQSPIESWLTLIGILIMVHYNTHITGWYSQVPYRYPK